MSGVGKTILVTGGGGYVASHCTVGLLQEDFNVIAVDNFVNCIRGEKNGVLLRTFLRTGSFPLAKKIDRAGEKGDAWN